MSYSRGTVADLEMKAYDQFYDAAREANRKVEVARAALASAEKEQEAVSAPARTALRKRLAEIRERYPLTNLKTV